MKPIISRTAYLAWLTTASFVFFQFFLQSTATIVSHDWTEEFQLNKIELGNLSSAFFYSYILMQIPVGILYDKFNAKFILATAALTLSAGCFLLSFATDYSFALLSRFFMGVGSACGFVGLLKIIVNYFPADRFALMFGIAEAIGMISVAFGVTLLAYFLESYTWRHVMFFSGIFSFILAVMITWFVHDRREKELKSLFSLKQLIKELKLVITNRQVILASLYGFFAVAIMNCFTSLWGKVFLMNTYPFNPQLSSMLISSVFVGLACGSPLSGWLSKKIGTNREIMLWGAGIATLVMSAIIFIPNIPISLLFLLFFFIGLLCCGYVPAFAVVQKSVKYEIQATALATANMIVVSSAPLSQLVVGFILENNSFGFAATQAENHRIALTILPLCYLSAFFISFYIERDSAITINKGN